MNELIVDISKHNGDVDFTKIKQAGIAGVILKVGSGQGTIDKWFKSNVTKAKEAGLHIGGYWFSYAYTTELAKKEAEYCYKILKDYPYTFDLPIFFDWENESYKYCSKYTKLNSELISNVATEFLTTLENFGYYVGLYSNVDYLNRYFNKTLQERFCLWVACWSNSCKYQGNYILWQFTDNYKIAGLNGVFDCSYLYTNVYKTIVNKGYNGYSKTTTNLNYDVNGDGKVTTSDLIALRKKLLEG